MPTRVCAEDDLEVGEAIKVIIDGVAVALVKDSVGRCFALGDTCSHGEISLSEGFVEGDEIECWAHGGTFELATGAPRALPVSEPVPVYPVTIVDGDVYVDVSTLVDVSAYVANAP